MSFIGTASTILVGVDTEFDPRTGRQIVQEWHGTASGLAALNTTLIALGYRTTLQNIGGQLKLTAAAGAVEEGVAEVPTDTFTLDKDFRQVPIWTHPKIITLVAQYRENSGGVFADYEAALVDIREKTTALLDGYVWDGETWIATHKGPTPISEAGITDPILEAIYRLMVQGAESYELELPIIRRLRSYSLAFAPRQTIDLIPKVYTTAALVRDYSIPALIAAQLPPDPPNSQLPANSAWAWRVRSDSSTVTWSGKVEETREWSFNACSTLLYELVT